MSTSLAIRNEKSCRLQLFLKTVFSITNFTWQQYMCVWEKMNDLGCLMYNQDYLLTVNDCSQWPWIKYTEDKKFILGRMILVCVCLATALSIQTCTHQIDYLIFYSFTQNWSFTCCLIFKKTIFIKCSDLLLYKRSDLLLYKRSDLLDLRNIHTPQLTFYCTYSFRKRIFCKKNLEIKSMF